MSKINLRYFYPFYNVDCIVEVPNETAEAIIQALERGLRNIESLQLREHEVMPTSEILGNSYTAYEVFQDALPSFDMEQEWQ